MGGYEAQYFMWLPEVLLYAGTSLAGDDVG